VAPKAPALFRFPPSEHADDIKSGREQRESVRSRVAYSLLTNDLSPYTSSGGIALSGTQTVSVLLFLLGSSTDSGAGWAINATTTVSVAHDHSGVEPANAATRSAANRG
jgi:hypothetical protein